MGRTQEGQLRWLGPEKGVIHMAAGAILNAVWDLWARIENKPLWELVCDLEPEALVKLIDFKHIQDYVSKEEALALLKNVRPGWEERKALMKSQGVVSSKVQRRPQLRPWRLAHYRHHSPHCDSHNGAYSAHP